MIANKSAFDRKQDLLYCGVLKIAAFSMIFSLLFFSGAPKAQAATYTFTQTSWSGGASATTAVHPSDQTGWNKYSAKDSDFEVVNGGADLQLGTTASSTAQTDSSTAATGFNYNSPSFSTTEVLGSGSSASVKLTQTTPSWSTAAAVLTSAREGLYYNYGVDTAVNASGLPHMAYISFQTEGAISYLQCLNIACTSVTNTTKIVTDENATFAGADTLSISLDPTDSYRARISYYSSANSLKYIKCGDASCSSANRVVATVDNSAANVGQYNDMDVGTDGLARIAYYDVTNSNLKFAKCNDANCSSPTIRTLASTDDVGIFVSLALNSSNLPRIIYKNSTDNSLAYIECTTDDCSSTTGPTTLDSNIGPYGNSTEMKMGSDGLARISYGDLSISSAAFIKCANTACTSASPVTIGVYGYSSYIIDMVLTSTDLPVFTHEPANGTFLTTLCADTACSSKSTSSISGSGYFINTHSLFITPDNLLGIVGSNNSEGYYNYQIATYNSSGTYTSGVIDVNYGVADWGTLSWTQSGGQTITLKARSSNSSSMSGATAFSSCSNISNGGAISTGGCTSAGHRYIQYQATLSTADTSATPALDDITIGSIFHLTSAGLTSSAYDASDAANVIGTLNWTEDSSMPSGTGVTVSLRTASSEAGLTGSWTDFTNATSGCSKASGTVTCSSSAIPSGMKDGSADRWFQYKVSLSTNDRSVTATVGQITVQYVVNASPEFDSSFGTTGISAYQNATSTDASFGKVQFIYKIRDPDTTTGSVTPGYVTPSFQYSLNNGSSWTNIATSTLATSTEYSQKLVAEIAYTAHSATWDAIAQLGNNTYSTTTKIKIILDDREGANNTASSTGAGFILDTKKPTNSIRIDVSASALYATSTDDSNLQYLLSNNSNGTADGSNSISGSWISSGAASVATSTSWTFSTSTYPTVYLQTRDGYNNTTTTTSIGPHQPANMDIKDVTNLASGVYKEFISWGVYTATTSAAFSKYELYRSTDASSYSLLTSITDSALNYYADGAVASTTTYYYKLRTVDSDNDVSAYSTVVNDLPNGQGGSDITAPTITSVAVAETQSTWARITWTTDELSNSTVEYSTSSGVYNQNQSSTSMVTSHSIVVSGLTPNTTYYFRVKSADALGNTRTDDNSSSGYTLTTGGGATISNVTAVPASTSAVINWNTDRSADSYVYYSTSSVLASPTVVGNATLVATSSNPSVFQHQVTLSNLTAATTYYYYVKSTDGSGNVAINNNNNNYYSFQTILDTTAPVISGIATPVLTSSAAVIIWITDEPATSQVSYGTAVGNYGVTTALDTTLTITHVTTLSSLTASTPYYFVVKSKDQTGNESTSAESSFATVAAQEIVVVGGGGGTYSPPQEIKDTTAPVISKVTAGTTTSFSVTIAFETDEPALGIIEYGTTDAYGQSNARSGFTKQHSLTLTGLRMGTEYHFRVKTLDKSGNESSSKDQTFTTQFLSEDLSNIEVKDLYQYQDEIENQIQSILPSVVPPFIGKILVSNITQDSADIAWQTNLNSYSTVQYAPEDLYNLDAKKPYTAEMGNLTTKATSHAVSLLNLQPNTRYHFRVRAYTLPEAANSSSVLTFITKAAQINANIAEVTINSFRVVWNTPDPADGLVEYRNLATGQINRKVDETKKTFHEITIKDLPPNTTFSVKVSSVNNKGNLIETKQPLKVTTGKDDTPPAISGLKIESTLVPGKQDKVLTLVRWTTDEPASSTVYYEEGSGSPNQVLSNKISGDENTYVTAHIVVLGSLKAGAIYRIQIESADAAGNLLKPPIKTIVVPRQSQSVTDIIFKNFEDSFKFLAR